MYVDGEQNGYISGLFWNDTETETYYMDIEGRTRNEVYDETGAIAIWPLDTGVTGFASKDQSACFSTRRSRIRIPTVANWLARDVVEQDIRTQLIKLTARSA